MWLNKEESRKRALYISLHPEAQLSGVLNMMDASRGHWLFPLTPTLLLERRTRVLSSKTIVAINVESQYDQKVPKIYIVKNSLPRRHVNEELYYITFYE